MRKSKNFFSDDIVDFLNEKINPINLYVRINNGKDLKAKFLNLSDDITNDVTVKTNKDLLERPLKYILLNTNGRIKNNRNFNEILINGICENIELNKIDEIKNLKQILNTKYSDALKFYSKDETSLKDNNLKCLKDLEKKFEKIPEKMKNKHEHLKKVHLELYGKIPPDEEKYDQFHEDEIIRTIKDFKKIVNNREGNIKNQIKKKKTE